jgi:cob(I)alamin adenosyltransferase
LDEIDELNSCVGLLLTEDGFPEMREVLNRRLHDLFELGGGVNRDAGQRDVSGQKRRER